MKIDVRPDRAVEAHRAFEQFKKDNDIGYVLAFSGGADDSNLFTKTAITSLCNNPDFDLDQKAAEGVISDISKHMISQVVRDVLGPLRGFRIAVQTGGTKWGVPDVAAKVAKEMGFTTIGIHPFAAIVGKDRVLSGDYLDLTMCVHPGLGDSRWGDESPHFAHCLDGAIIIGGGAGTMVEVSHLLKINESKDLVHKKMIIPIIGTGGTADQVHSFPGKPQVMSRCIPSHPVTSGTEAYEFILHDVFKETDGDSNYDVFPYDNVNPKSKTSKPTSRSSTMSKLSKKDLMRPSGFPDLTVSEAVAIRNATAVIREEYELAGYSPLTTSIVERPVVLTAKNDGEILSQIYALRLLNPAPDAETDVKELALRFDHTVPLARYVAAHERSMQFPFRRYAIGPVFRGERPKKGRYRQFTQADIDVIGRGSLDLLHDAEMVSVIARVFNRLQVGDFTIRIGHRKVLQGLLEVVGLKNETDQLKALAEIDRIDKIGWTAVSQNLQDIGLSSDDSEQLLQLLETQSLEELKAVSENTELLSEGVSELQQVFDGIGSYEVPTNRYKLDLKIARGLAYYTGTVYETVLDAHPKLGSVASGGRYENLAGSFSDQEFPGVGISIGVTRVMKALIEAKIYPAKRLTVAKAMLGHANQSHETKMKSLRTATALREKGIPIEVYVEPAKLGKQLTFADKKGFDYTIIIGGDGTSLDEDKLVLRHMESGDEGIFSLSEIISRLK